MKDIMVSILVLTYGHEKYIAQALDSILKQKTQYAYEVIVGEDASPDHTREILQQYEKKYPNVFTMIYRDTNYGAALNGIDLIRRSSGKYIIILEGDDFWISEDKLERQIKCLEEHPQYTAVAHNCLIVDQNSIPVEKRYPECKDTEYTLRHFRQNILPGQTATILYRATLYKEIISDKIWKLHPLPGDRITILGAIAKGSIYCIQEKMSAYRYITSDGTSYSANMNRDFGQTIEWHKMLIDFSRRLNNRNAEVAAEGRYLATIFFEGVLKRRITPLQALRLCQYISHKPEVLITKFWDYIIRSLHTSVQYTIQVRKIIMSKISNAIYWFHECKRYMGIKRKCFPFHKYMLDSESKRIMRLRERYISHPDIETFIRQLAKGDVQFEISELPLLPSQGNVILYLMVEDATAIKRLNYTKILLEHSIWRERFYCVKIHENFNIQKEDIVVPVWGTADPDTDFLLSKIPVSAQLHIPLYAEVLLGTIGKQYFDVFSPCRNEIVIDCGTYDGTTELEIAEWTNYNYRKIYALEPNLANCQKCALFYAKRGLKNIELIQKGSWSKDTVLSFSIEQNEKSAGGRIGSGTEQVPVTTIDHIVGHDKITFIKMDVEGAELESLRGAAETIQRDAPKLAICIYHKFEDLWTIPEYILKLNSHYRFYMRHYTSYIYETVLYAIAD